MQVFRLYTLLFIGIFLIIDKSCSQENSYTHFFSVASFLNPAFAGDVRYASIQADNRMVLNSGAKASRNSLILYDQKFRNYRSGLSFALNQNVSDLKEIKLKANYSYSVSFSKRYWLKTGVGISWNFINSNSPDYKYPDQYNNSGYTGQPTGESSLNERSNYPGFSAGVVFYDEGLSWISFAVDDINRPVQNFAGVQTHVPVTWMVNGAIMFPLDKNKKTRRIFAHNGGIEPYSSIGPVIGFYKKGVFNAINFGINGFIRPVFFVLTYNYNSYKSNFVSNGLSTMRLLLGYRVESISIAYSYDLRLDKNDINFRGAHEISLKYYIFTAKKDFVRNKLVPLPNQLMY